MINLGTIDNCYLSYPNFIRGLSFVDLLILASRLMALNASYSTKQMIIPCFDQEWEIYPKETAKGSF